MAKTNRKPAKLAADLSDPLVAAQAGAHKLSLAVDALRSALETIAVAEYDHEAGRPVSAQDLRAMAVQGLDAYSAIAGQNWRRHPIIGSRAGDRSDATGYA